MNFAFFLRRFGFGLIIFLTLAFGVRWAGTLAMNLSFLQSLNARMGGSDWQLAPCGSDPSAWATILGTNALRQNSEESNAWRTLGLGLWFEGDCQGAVESLKQAGKINDPKSIFAQLDLGEAFLSLGDYDQALSELKQTDAAIYFTAVAGEELAKGKKESAYRLYQFAYDIKPIPEAADALANDYVEQNQVSKAIDVWTSMARAYPDDNQFHWLALAEAARLQKDWSTAQMALGRAAELSSDPYNLLLRMDRILWDAKDYIGIIATSEKLIQLKPAATSEPYVLVAKAEAELGNYQAALMWCDKAVVILPHDPWPDYEAGMIYKQVGDLNSAEERFVRAERIEPNNFSVNLQLGLLKYQQGDISNAISYLERIVPSGNCGVIQMLGEWYARSSNKDRSSYYTNLWNAQCKK